jgi:hypothetical protein
VVEAHRTHDVLHVARIPELFAVELPDLGTRALALQQEGVAVVEEIHALRGERVDGGHLAAQRCPARAVLKAAGSSTIKRVALLVAQARGVVAAGPRVVQAGLVAAQVHLDVACGQALPQVHDVAQVGDAVRFTFLLPVQAASMQTSTSAITSSTQPWLVAFVRGGGVHFGADRHHARRCCPPWAARRSCRPDRR